MNASDVIRRLHQHRAWVNGNLLTSAALLTEEQLHGPFQIGQGSIWKSLVHLYAAEYVWLEALLGNEAGCIQGDLPGQRPGNQLGEGKIAGLLELRQKWAALDQHWSNYLASLTDESLEDIVHRVSSSSFLGKRFGSRRSDILLHVCTHAQYTTAQVVNMLRHVSTADLPDSMLITLARRETL